MVVGVGLVKCARPVAHCGLFYGIAREFYLPEVVDGRWMRWRWCAEQRREMSKDFFRIIIMKCIDG